MIAFLAVIAAAVTPAAEHHHRHHHRRRPMLRAVASWYDEHGTGACAVGDVQTGLRFASLFLPCGARVRFCHDGRCATGVMSDHGPYVAGRLFDLNGNLNVILRCGLCSLSYRVVRR